MQAHVVVFPQPRQVAVETINVPEPKAGQILLRTSCSLISTGTECICLAGEFEEDTVWHRWVKYPFRPGYSLVGHVVRVGAGVTNLREGDRVVAACHHQSFALADASRVFPVPDGVSDEQAAWAVLAYIAQHGFRKANLQLGETVVVIGLGPVGQLMAQYARTAGAGRVIAVDPVGTRLEQARGYGIRHTLALRADQAVEAVRELTGGRMAEVVCDMTGAAPVLPAALALAGRFGRVLLVGDTPHPGRQHLTRDILRRDLTLIGAHGPNAAPPDAEHAPWSHARMVDVFFNLLIDGRMGVDDLISHRFDLRDAPRAYDLLMTQRDKAMGVLLRYA